MKVNSKMQPNQLINPIKRKQTLTFIEQIEELEKLLPHFKLVIEVDKKKKKIKRLII